MYESSALAKANQEKGWRDLESEAEKKIKKQSSTLRPW